MQTTSTTISQATPLCVMPTTNGRTMPLTAEEFPLYQLHITHFFAEFRPQGNVECSLVQRIADNEWRIDGISQLEMGYYTYGQVEFAHLFPEQPSSIRSVLIRTHTHKTYARQLSSLNAQESRLRRYVEKDTAALLALQTERGESEKNKKAAAVSTPAPAIAAVNGFEFSYAIESAAIPADINTEHPAPEAQTAKRD